MAHRLNNILKHAFYQVASKKQRASSIDSIESDHILTQADDVDEESDVNDDECTSTAEMIGKIPSDALVILQTIHGCKQLVAYVKKVMDFCRIARSFDLSLYRLG
jgi:hypothetical protein